MKIILKADDLAGYPGKKEAIPKRWQKFVDIIDEYSIKATIGIIGNSLIFDDKSYFDWIKNYHNNIIEFWNHGFLHRQFNFDGEVYQEFKNTTKEYQLKLIKFTNDLAKEKLNIEFKTFGAPYNAVDINTANALNETSITHWFFGLDSFKGVNLKNRIELEYPVHKINLKYFIENFKFKDKYLVIQLHPNSWDERMFKDFIEAIKFMKDNNCEFIFAKDLV